MPSATSPGFASASWPGFGWKLTFGVFLWHWIYGYFLGTVYCPSPQDATLPATEETAA